MNGFLLPASQTEDFSFAVIGEMRMSFRGRPYAAQTIQMLDEIKMLSPTFAASVGGSIYGYGDTLPQFKEEIDYLRKTVETLELPFFHIIGNREIAGDREKELYLKQICGNLYGSFDYGKSHFVILDTEENGGDGGVSKEQLAWLERDLGENKDASHLFVFMHRPLYPVLMNEDETDRIKGFYAEKGNLAALADLFQRYHVNVVFAGHEHLFHEAEIGGTRYLTTGGGGAPLYSIKSRGGFLHFVLVRIKGGHYEYEIIRPDSIKIKTVSGNNGRERKAVLEIANSSSTDLDLMRLEVKMPWKKEAGYTAAASGISAKDRGVPEIVSITRDGQNRASVTLKLHLPPESRVKLTVLSDDGR